MIRTPLVRLYVEGAPAEIYLKLENLQPVNSFKIRGAMNAVMLASPGDWTKAPEAKLSAIERLGGEVLKVLYHEWWNIIFTSRVGRGGGPVRAPRPGSGR